MKEKTISTKKIYHGRVIGLDLVKVAIGKKTYSKREIVRHTGASAIVAVLPKQKIVFVKQYRKPVEKELLEIPAGTLSKGESPAACARRELLEETGYKTRYIKKLASFYPSPGYSNEIIHIFKATGLLKGKSSPESDEFIKTTVIPLRKVNKLIKQGRIKDGKTLIALSILCRN